MKNQILTVGVIVATAFHGAKVSAKNSDSMHAGVRAGMLHTCLGSQGWEINWAVSPNYRLGLSVLRSNISMDSSVLNGMAEYVGTSGADTISPAQIVSAYMVRTMLLAENRIFPVTGHSFNIGFGAGVAELHSDFRLVDPESQNLIEEKISYQQTTAYITIGNFWSWKHFYIAADWVGTGRVLSFKKDVKTSAAGDSVSATAAAGKSVFDEALVKAGEEGGGTVLNFSLGIVF